MAGVTGLSSLSTTTLVYTFANQIVEPPANGQVRLNGDWPYDTVTKIWARYLSGDGFDVFYALREIPVDARVILQDKNDHTRAVEFRLVAVPLDQGTYFELPVVWVQDSGATLNGGQDIALVIQVPDTAPPPIPPTPGPATVALVTFDMAVAHLKQTGAVFEADPDLQRKIEQASAIVVAYVKRPGEWTIDSDPASEPDFAIVQGAVLHVIGNLFRFRGDDDNEPSVLDTNVMNMLALIRDPALA